MKASVKNERSLTTPEELAELAALYDTYGNLLKDGQRDIFEAYVLDNLSLSEIAEEQGMTRQGVYDTINRSRKKLREYEERLGIIERTTAIERHLDDMEQATSSLRSQQTGESQHEKILTILDQHIQEIRDLL
ncbi:MAG: sigma factor-like helix-turn-helix DNA-binding protein [Eubacterium sp.]|nr:sigma factor-like helix-turn-helix DNA-binding protein [Eubacterium sp.]